MSISSETTKSGPYLGDGVTVDFPITFSVSATTDVEVVRTPVATGIDEVITTGFAVDIDTPQVTFDTAPTSAYKITLRVGTPYKQLKGFVSFGGVQADQVEDMGDILTRQNLRQKEILDRVVKGSTTETSDLTLPVASAGKAIKWNDDGDGFENSTYDPDEQVTNAAASASAANSSASSAASSANAASSSAAAAAASAATITFRVSEETYVDGDLSTGILTLTPPSGTTEIVSYTLYDNSGDQYLPDGSTDTTIDLTSFGTLTGTHTFKGLWK